MRNDLIQKLAEFHRLELEEYQYLIDHRDEESAQILATLAKQAAQKAIQNLGNKLLGGDKEAADSTAATSDADKKKEVVGKVLNLFKKK